MYIYIYISTNPRVVVSGFSLYGVGYRVQDVLKILMDLQRSARFRNCGSGPPSIRIKTYTCKGLLSVWAPVWVPLDLGFRGRVT